MTNNTKTLTNTDIEIIRILASDVRKKLAYTNETPIACDLFSTLQKSGINLIEYPIKTNNKEHAFSAAIFSNKINDIKYTFLALNTADYFDKQLFAIAHEFYHYYANREIINIKEEPDKEDDLKANRFAAEFLLPYQALSRILLNEFKTLSLEDLSPTVLLRFIARLYCAWLLPFQAIVRRLHEINAISLIQHDNLLMQNERDESSDFAKFCMAINAQTFKKLNSRTNKTGTSANNIETIIRNYEKEIIDEYEFIKVLNLFDIDSKLLGYSFDLNAEDYCNITDILEMEE